MFRPALGFLDSFYLVQPYEVVETAPRFHCSSCWPWKRAGDSATQPRPWGSSSRRYTYTAPARVIYPRASDQTEGDTSSCEGRGEHLMLLVP